MPIYNKRESKLECVTANENKTETMNIEEAKRISIVELLKREGFTAVVVRGRKHWYCSPLRKERTPSFMVNDARNDWYDFGLAEGGDIVELAKRLYGLDSVSETLRILSGGDNRQLVRKPDVAKNRQVETAQRMQNVEVLPLRSHALLSYLTSRRVDTEIGRMYCREIHYDVYGKHYYAIAFGNISGGYELRSMYFKGCIYKKDITLIAHSFGTKQAGCMVFEGFMDFLSYLTAARRGDKYMQMDEPCDYLVMNSVSNLRKSLQHLGQYEHIHCFLDNDLAGQKTCETIASLYENRVSDESFRYADYKDLNDYLLGRKR